MFKNLFKIHLTEEDTKIQELVKTFLSKEETLIEIDPSDMSYILSYEPKSYYLMADSLGIKISNHNFSKDIRLEHNKLSIIKDLIRDEAAKRRNEKKKLIFQNNLELMEKITTNIMFDEK